MAFAYGPDVLLIQPPRFVEDATSGLSVTTRAAASGALRFRSDRNRPSAAWVETTALWLQGSESGRVAISWVWISGLRSRCFASRQALSSSVPGLNFRHGDCN